jgi:hypothetical protein
MTENRSPLDRGGRLDRFDLAIAFLLAAATAVYLSWLPWSLGAADESFFLYEAKRIRQGQVMYRDFFQFVAPAAWYFQALLFRIFGTDIATARVSTAVLHALTVAATYAGARRLGVRRELALIPPFAYVALCQPAWGEVSPHWYSTFLIAVLLLVAIPGAWAWRARASFAIGALVGALIVTQQQKGVITAGGIAALFVADALLSRLYAAPRPVPLLAQLAWLAAGVALIAGTSMLAMIAAAGWRPVFDDLVLYPIREYRGATSARWGAVGPLSRGQAAYTWPALLRFLPLAGLPAALRLGFALVPALTGDAGDRWRGGLPNARRLLVLLSFLVTAVLSTLYNPDFIHLAFIAPVAFLVAAETVEWALSLEWIRPGLAARVVGLLALVIAAAVLGRQIAHNTARRRAAFPVSHQTAFGRVDFGQPWEPLLIDRLRAALDRTPGRELFCYPFASSPYLTADGNNPTPYQHLAPSQSPAWQVAQAVAIVRERRVPYIVAAPVFLSPKDPIAKLLDEGYEYVDLGPADGPGMLPRLWLFERHDLPETATGAPPP